LREFRAPELFTRAPYRLQSVMSGFLPFFFLPFRKRYTPISRVTVVPSSPPFRHVLYSPSSITPSEFAESEFAEQMHESECREALGTSDTYPNSSAHA
jgi:hypothetical protein